MLHDAFERTKALTDAHDDMGRVYANLSSALMIAGRAEESVDDRDRGRRLGAFRRCRRRLRPVHRRQPDRGPGRTSGRWDEAEGWLDDQLDADAVGVNRLGLIGVAGALHARRGHAEVADRLLREGAVRIEPLVEAQFTGPIHAALAEHLADRPAGRPRRRRRRRPGSSDSIASTTTTTSAICSRWVPAPRRIWPSSPALGATRRAPIRRRPCASGYAERARGYAADVARSRRIRRPVRERRSVAAAEAQRAAGTADPGGLARALDALGSHGHAWPIAYSRYRLADALIGSRAPRREAEAALSRHSPRRRRLSAAPLTGWIEALARRARISLTEPGSPAVTEAPEPDEEALATSG